MSWAWVDDEVASLQLHGKETFIVEGCLYVDGGHDVIHGHQWLATYKWPEGPVFEPGETFEVTSPSTHDDGRAISMLHRALPQLDAETADCPRCDKYRNYLLIDVIIHLNDGHELPRDQIADWLEGLGL